MTAIDATFTSIKHVQKGVQVDKQVYTIMEFVKTYGVSRSATYREIKIGRLRAVKIGRRTMILLADANTWLNRLPSCKIR